MPHVTFIHGLANKPPKDDLLRSWLGALAGSDGGGLDLAAAGVSSDMVYWADVLYPSPAEADQETVDEEVSRDITLDLVVSGDPDDPDQQFARQLEQRLETAAREVEAKIAAESAASAERFFPLPKALERRLMKSLVRDAHHYLYGSTFEPRPGERFDVRQELRDRFVKAVAVGNAKPGPHVVVSHSMGAIIAYDCLKRVSSCESVDALITLGSPLGLSEVQDGFGKDWEKDTAYPDQRIGADAWANFYDRLDLVCAADPKLANDYRLGGNKVVNDVRIRNVGRWRHAVREYLARDRLRDRLRKLLRL